MRNKIKSMNYVWRVSPYAKNMKRQRRMTITAFTLMGSSSSLAFHIFSILNSKSSPLFRDRNNERRTHSRRGFIYLRVYKYTADALLHRRLPVV